MPTHGASHSLDPVLLTAIVETACGVIVGLRPDHRIFLWNEAAETIYQTSRERALGADYVATFIAPEHRAAVAADIREVLAGKRTQKFEHDSILPEGQRRTLVWNVSRLLDPDGTPAGVVAIGHDITDRREAETRFRLVFEHAQDGLLISDHTGVIDCNPAALAMLGLTDKSQLIGRRPAEFSPPTQPDGRPSDAKSRALGAETLSQGAHVFDWVHQRPDGSPVPVEVSVRHARLDGRRVSVVSWRDQSRRLELERERAALQERLDLAQKMEAVGQLAGGIAHDFNNLLAAIRNAVQLAADALPDDAEARHDLDIAQHAADRAAGLTRQLLAFSRQQARVNEVVDLVALVRDMVPLLRTSIPTSIALSLRAEVDEAGVLADRSQLEQVVLNLVLNARDAMPRGGALQVAVGTDPEQQLSTLTVSDTGTGMEEATRQRIFEPFFTTKPTGSGTGLGLAVVYGVVTQAGGTIDVDSAPGRGTTMRITWPLAEGTAVVRGRETATPTTSSRTVLLVDDDMAVRSTTRRLLERQGWRVFEAGEGEDALQLFGRHRDEVAIVLTDLRMPGLGGADLVRRLRAIAPDVPAVFISGYDELEAQHLQDLANVPLLAKPFAASDLLAILHQTIDADA
jgi:PAS domain S-box-containing protein